MWLWVLHTKIKLEKEKEHAHKKGLYYHNPKQLSV